MHMNNRKISRNTKKNWLSGYIFISDLYELYPQGMVSWKQRMFCWCVTLSSETKSQIYKLQELFSEKVFFSRKLHIKTNLVPSRRTALNSFLIHIAFLIVYSQGNSAWCNLSHCRWAELKEIKIQLTFTPGKTL